jgi:alkylation response protein AidB-like acyl-CoA dehydrogenase
MEHGSLMEDLARLEQGLGDPWDSANPLGHAAVVRADEEGNLAPAGEALLDRIGLNAEFVPAALGGRLADPHRLVALLRAVFRRDPCLGLGYGASSLLAAVNVWTAGSPQQQQWAAGVLLRNGKIACAYHELEHGNDIGRAACAAQLGEHSARLDGVKQVVANLARARALVVYARTAADAGPRSHSLVLLDRAELDPATVTDLPRHRSSGMRGVPLGGVRFDGCEVPRSRLLGHAGHGMETALKAFQLTRIVLPAMFLGAADSALRLAVRYCRGRVLYGRRADQLPLVRARLAESFADLLLCDGFSHVAANGLCVQPAQSNLHAAAVKALVPAILVNATNTLAAVVGAHSYVREGDMAMFQKLLRDLQPVGFGHASRISCLLTLMPQLPLLARRGWQVAAEPPAQLFALAPALQSTGGIAFSRLALSAAGQDSLAGALRAWSSEATDCPAVDAWTAKFATELRKLEHACMELRAPDTGPAASPRVFALAGRYTVLLAAAACIGIWREARRGPDSPSGSRFAADPTWLLAVLHRAAAQLGWEEGTLPPHLCAALYDELAIRYHARRSFDLADHPLCASDGWR